ncbi:MAG TPA: hypothetical protein VMW03_05820 [Candidatus Krumholzibacteriaceae bacterium]|nr:hypothetical protein [Candidatus Krumholzibacteriaceae bacterium]
MSAKARKLFNPWNIALVTLLVGLMLGYQVNDVLSSGKISSLQETVDDHSAMVTALEQQVAVLQENYTKVQDDLARVTELYEILQNNAVLRSIYDELLEDYEDATQERDDAIDRVSELEDQVSVLEEEYDELQDSYFKLWNKYNNIRVLSWTYFVVNGLEVNLTTTELEYDTNTNIEGNVRIHHVGGEPFNGTFVLNLRSDFYGAGTSSGEKQIYGEAEYTFKNPFIFGTGTYALSISTIKDAEGNVVAGIAQLREYSIKINMG